MFETLTAFVLMSPLPIWILLGLLASLCVLFIERLVVLAFLKKSQPTIIHKILEEAEYNKDWSPIYRLPAWGINSHLKKLVVLRETNALHPGSLNLEWSVFTQSLKQREGAFLFLSIVSVIIGLGGALLQWLSLQYYHLVSEDIWDWFMHHRLSLSLTPLLCSLGLSLIALLIDSVLHTIKQKRIQESKLIFHTLEMLWSGHIPLQNQSKIHFEENDPLSSTSNPEFPSPQESERFDEEEII